MHLAAVRRVPQRSSSIPAGNWHGAYDQMKADSRYPTATGVSANCWISTGMAIDRTVRSK